VFQFTLDLFKIASPVDHNLITTKDNPESQDRITRNPRGLSEEKRLSGGSLRGSLQLGEG
jgi:hypothetical protein